ncbi:DUF3120 domain-containing protein [Rubidibacter lacunae]|nr:DUF3120 domain-containing protein [Rubidibacter lacunae]
MLKTSHYPSVAVVAEARQERPVICQSQPDMDRRSRWQAFWAAVFLVSVPVFAEAPLVRQVPWLCLLLTLGWLWMATRLRSRPQTALWGDILLGFVWTWVTGAIYWGWLRWEPLAHIPVEALGLPLAVWCILRGWGLLGNWFYLGSLLGTALTDAYLYLTDLTPYWREVMRVDPQTAVLLLREAALQVQTPWGIANAIAIAALLVAIGLWALQKPQPHWRAFAGAVLCTIVVDGLFWTVALLG